MNFKNCSHERADKVYTFGKTSQPPHLILSVGVKPIYTAVETPALALVSVLYIWT